MPSINLKLVLFYGIGFVRGHPERMSAHWGREGLATMQITLDKGEGGGLAVSRYTFQCGLFETRPFNSHFVIIALC